MQTFIVANLSETEIKRALGLAITKLRKDGEIQGINLVTPSFGPLASVKRCANGTIEASFGGSTAIFAG
jgi:hypothetical protein